MVRKKKRTPLKKRVKRSERKGAARKPRREGYAPTKGALRDLGNARKILEAGVYDNAVTGADKAIVTLLLEWLEQSGAKKEQFKTFPSMINELKRRGHAIPLDVWADVLKVRALRNKIRYGGYTAKLPEAKRAIEQAERFIYRAGGLVRPGDVLSLKGDRRIHFGERPFYCPPRIQRLSAATLSGEPPEQCKSCYRAILELEDASDAEGVAEAINYYIGLSREGKLQLPIGGQIYPSGATFYFEKRREQLDKFCKLLAGGYKSFKGLGDFGVQADIYRWVGCKGVRKAYPKFFAKRKLKKLKLHVSAPPAVTVGAEVPRAQPKEPFFASHPNVTISLLALVAHLTTLFLYLLLTRYIRLGSPLGLSQLEFFSLFMLILGIIIVGVLGEVVEWRVGSLERGLGVGVLLWVALLALIVWLAAEHGVPTWGSVVG